MNKLAFLIATYDAIPLYEKSLSAQIRDPELKLRSVIRRMLFTLDHYEGWVPGRLNVELYNLERAPASELEALNEQICQRVNATKESGEKASSPTSC